MTFWVLVLLGVVQGICEFLPISSSGHLVLLSSIFGVQESLFVSIIFHLATLFAVVVIFRKDLWRMIKNPFSNEVILLAVATIMTCIIALIFMPLLKDSFAGGILPISFLLSAIFLFFSEKRHTKPGKIGIKKAILIGLAQGVALVPGISRSGTTISAGLIAGAEKKECAKFSFLLSIPIIVASLLLEIVEVAKEGLSVNINIVGLVVGGILAFSIALVSIKFMLKLTEKTNLKWFSLYLVFMSILSGVIFW
ncbi:MAG: undecaprenyl-diphosphate phosphatase [Clostridiales bacterium]|nr:undecaprenyl-diphosphate phosphatase [Clostridiales bacterium]